jgi:hypothetical protein
MRESVAARRNMLQMFCTVTAVFPCRSGIGYSIGGLSGTSPERCKISVEPSATEGGFDLSEAIAKKPITATNTISTAPVSKPSRNLPIG